MSSGNQRYINTAGTHNITMGDDFINVSTSVGAITLVFPNIRDSGAINLNKVWFVNDVDDMAATNNVTIVASDTSPVTELNGGTSVVLDTNGFSAEIVPSGYYNYMVNSGTGEGGMTGSGTLNYVAKFTPSGTILGNSLLFDNGTGVALGTNSPFTNSLFSIKGVDVTSINYWVKAQDSATSPLFYGKNNGYIGFGCDPANAKFEFSGGNILLLSYGARFSSIAVGAYSSWGLLGNEISTLETTTGTPLVLQYTEQGRVGIGTNTPTAGTRLHVYRAVNDFLYEVKVENPTNGASAASSILIQSDNGKMEFGQLSTLFTTYTGYGQTGDTFIRSGVGARNLNITTDASNVGKILFFSRLNPTTDAASPSLCIDGSRSGFNRLVQSDTVVSIKGTDATSSNYALKVDNSASAPLLYVRNDGRISMNNLPTSNAGLSSGDLYVSSAADILANGDLVVGRKV